MSLPFLFVQGTFSGNYFTDQGSTLVDGQPMPGPDKHHVRLYRGELHDIVPLKEFNPQDHLNRDALYLYNVTNIQLHPGNKQYIQEKIVYDFEQVVIKDARVKDSWEIDGKTYGIVEGTFLGKIKVPSNAPEPTDPQPHAPEPINPEKPPIVTQFSGCLTKLWDILKWLLLLLLLLLLLKKCNPSGCNLGLNNCKDCQEELARLRKQIDSLNGDNTIGCSQAAKSGGRGITEKKHILGNQSGRVIIQYDMETVPDKMEVFYEGTLVASTNQVPGNEKGFVGGKNAAKCCGALTFDFQYNKDDHCMVRVTGGSSDTKWKYTLFCPQQ
jgi:hypothetical protein